MASTLIRSIVTPTYGGPHSTNLYPVLLPRPPAGGVLSPVLRGAIVRRPPVAENQTVKQGRLWNGIAWTFYYRILIEPSELDLGNLLSAQTRKILVWNGFFENKTITEFEESGTEGIELDTPVNPPYVLRPLEELTYNLRIETTGPPVIDAILTWTIDGVDYTAEITGRRVVVFAFPPNWSDDVVETLEWKTDVMRSYSGLETRRSLRTKARRSLSYKYSLLSSKDTQLFQNALYGWQNRSYAMPVWSDATPATATLHAGSQILQCDTIGRSFQVGDTALLFQDSSTYEVVEILTIADTALTIRRPLAQDWPINTGIYPIITGRVGTSVSYNQITDNKLEGTVDFVTNPTEVDPYTPDGPATNLYNGVEVITIQPNWASQLQRTSDFLYQTVDFDTGALQWLPQEAKASFTAQFGWLLSSRAMILEFRKFLGRQRGQQIACWVPSWTDDFTVIATVGSTDPSIQVADTGFRDLVGTDTNRNHIMIRTRDGQVYYRQILGVSKAQDDINSALILDSALGKQYAPDDFVIISILSLCRFNNDSFDINWKRPGIATVDSVFKQVTA